MNSVGAEGRLLPIEPKLEVEVWLEPAILPLSPMLKFQRCEAMLLALMPVKMLLASTPLNWKVLEVARWPLAQMFWLPRPALLSRLLSSSALTPGESGATWVKLPVARGVSAICAASKVLPLVES